MRFTSPCRTGALLGALALLIAACGAGSPPGAQILSELEPGIMKGDVYYALGPGPMDSTVYAGPLEYGYPMSQYLVNGEIYEIFWVPDPNEAGAETITYGRATPVLSHNLVFQAWGWDAVGRWAEENGVGLPER